MKCGHCELIVNNDRFPNQITTCSMLTTTFIFSIQIVERAYKNKNGGGFIHRTALSGLFARCRIVEKRKTSVGT